ncbi:MAG: PIN domain-containing protein [Terriglobia bacterium]
MRIVVDTNIIISALVFGGVPRGVIDLAVAGAYSFYFSPAIQAEVEEVLEDKFGWTPKEIAAHTNSLELRKRS